MRWDYLLHTNHLISSATTTRTRKLSYTGLTLHRSVAAGIVYSLIVPSAMCLGVEPYICYGVSWGLASASEPRARRGVPHYNMFFPFVVSCFVAIFPLLMLSLKYGLCRVRDATFFVCGRWSLASWLNHFFNCSMVHCCLLSHDSSSRGGEPCRGNGQSDAGFMGASPAGAVVCHRSPARQGGYHDATQRLAARLDLSGRREYTLRSRSGMVGKVVTLTTPSITTIRRF